MMRSWRSCQLTSCPCIRATIGIWMAVLLVGMGTTSAPAAQTPATGQTVADGVYTEAQAARGKETYEQNCSFCHLSDLTGEGFAPALVEDTFTQRWTDGNLGELYTIVKATMPQDKPDSLTEVQYAGIVAYILKVNKYPAGQQELRPDLAALKGVAFKRPGAGAKQ